MSVKVSASGPLFDGTVEKEMDRVRQEIDEEIGQELYDAVQTELRTVLKHPTGRYQRSVRINRSTSNVSVSDGGVVYGPWLEGTSSRNATTRFKGYTTFRRMTQKVDRRSKEIAERVLGRHIGRMS